MDCGVRVRIAFEPERAELGRFDCALRQPTR